MLQISIIPSVNHVKVILETYAQLDLTDANSSIKISTQFSQVVIVKETISLVNRGQRKKKKYHMHFIFIVVRLDDERDNKDFPKWYYMDNVVCTGKLDKADDILLLTDIQIIIRDK